MEEEEDYSSDTSDEDYVPIDGEAASEEELSGEEETPLIDHATSKGQHLKGKRKKITKSDGPRKRRGGIKLDADDDNDEQAAIEEDDQYSKKLAEDIENEKKQKKEMEDKSKADSLWADFMKDVGPSKPKPKPATGLSSLTSISKPKAKVIPFMKDSQDGASSSVADSSNTSGSKPSKVTITTEYDFAGEVVKVTKEVDADSKEAKAELLKKKAEEEKVKETPKDGPSISGLKKPGGGLGNLLGKIEKKQKMSTLVKSKLDWDSFKKDEGIQDELQIHNRGKDAYLERQAFLERTDYRQFEIERNLRITSSKR